MCTCIHFFNNCYVTTLISLPFKSQWHQMVTFKIVQYHPDDPGLTYIFNFLHSGTLALRAERQSARIPEIKNVG